jgi:hypothetical protein
MTLSRRSARLLDNRGLPSAFRAADGVSLNAQQRAVRERATQLVLLLLAAVAGAFSWRVSGGFDVAAGLAAILFALALVLERVLATGNPERTWYRGRAGAESVKTLAWKYSVGGDPFLATDPNADSRFLAAVRNVKRGLEDLDWGSDVGEQITEEMQRVRNSSLEERRRIYQLGRIDDQRAWYTAKAANARKQARRWSVVIAVTTASGLIGAVAKSVSLFNVDALGVASAFAAAATAWTQLKQYDSLASAYTVAANDLRLVSERLAETHDEQSWARLVTDAENAISREHTMWVARRNPLY